MNELQLIENNEEFEKALNEATGYSQKLPVPKHLKFNAEEGSWMEETDQKDVEGKPIYKTLGESINLHIVLANRKMVNSKFGSKKFNFYSREFTGNYVELLSNDENGRGQVFDSGNYKDLKLKYGDELVYIQALYVYYEGNPYRIKLSGSKLGNWFNITSDVNPALYEITASKGEEQKNGAVKYFELKFEVGKRIDAKIIVERVNSFNKYVNAYSEYKNATESQILQNSGYPYASDPYFDQEIIKIEDYGQEKPSAADLMRQGMNK